MISNETADAIRAAGFKINTDFIYGVHVFIGKHGHKTHVFIKKDMSYMAWGVPGMSRVKGKIKIDGLLQAVAVLIDLRNKYGVEPNASDPDLRTHQRSEETMG